MKENIKLDCSKKKDYSSPKCIELGNMLKITKNSTGSKCDTGNTGGSAGSGNARCH